MRIRLPDDLKAKVKALADENHRSMNAEIVARLEWSLMEAVEAEPRKGLSFTQNVRKDQIADLYEKIKRLEGRLEALENKK